MLTRLRSSALSEEFDYNFVLNALSDYRNPRVKINDLLKKGVIIRVKKGLYVFGPSLAQEPYSKETLANLIYGPSYISLEYALSFYSLIPERVEQVTSVTNKRKKMFYTPIGNFSYRYIHPALYSYGVTLCSLDARHSVMIAKKEKALADMLYFEDKMKSESQMEKYLFENLRFEEKGIAAFSLRDTKKLASLYGHNVNLFSTLLEKMK